MKSGFLTSVKSVRDRLRQVRGPQLVSAVALRAFFSFFPLLLVGISVLGFLAKNDKELPQKAVDKLGLTGSMRELVEQNISSSAGSAKAASVVGGISLLWAGLGVVGAIAAACDAVWQVPTRGLKDKLLGVVWLLGFVALGIGSAATVWVAQRLPIPFLDLAVGFVLGVVVGGGVFWWTNVVFTNARLPLRAHFPGALIGGIGFAAFQLLGARLTPLLTKSSEIYATLGGVFGLLTLLTLFGWLLVLSNVVNVVRWEKGHGTSQVVATVPALPKAVWAQVERGGQIPKPKKPTKFPGQRSASR